MEFLKNELNELYKMVKSHQEKEEEAKNCNNVEKIKEIASQAIQISNYFHKRKLQLLKDLKTMMRVDSPNKHIYQEMFNETMFIDIE